MNSLEFIKQHVTEWPDDKATQVLLYNDGVVVFANPTIPPPYHPIDLSEHFAPDYHDGRVWTREEFESVGNIGGLPSWDIAPEWATSLGTVGVPNNLIWYDDKSYVYVEQPDREYIFDVGHNHNFHEVKRIVSRAHPVTPNEPSVDATVEERGSRYGAFKDGADIMQSLKTVMRDTPNWSSLTPSQREALEMIQHKIGRILNGDPNYTDSWHDIQGYARLVEEELNGNVK